MTHNVFNKDQPLSEKEFEACKLIVNAKRQDDHMLLAMGLWTYSHYLLIRWMMKDRNKRDKYALACYNDPTHNITVMNDRCRISTNLETGEIEILDADGDEGHCCMTCDPKREGYKKARVAYGNVVDEFEALENN